MENCTVTTYYYNKDGSLDRSVTITGITGTPLIGPEYVSFDELSDEGGKDTNEKSNYSLVSYPAEQAVYLDKLIKMITADDTKNNAESLMYGQMSLFHAGEPSRYILREDGLHKETWVPSEGHFSTLEDEVIVPFSEKEK